jgi:hypothetical protein
MSWIGIDLTNGLGNRFFQIAALIKAAEQTQRKPVLFLPRMSRYEHGNWKYFLQCIPDIEIKESDSHWKEGEREQLPDRLDGEEGYVLKGWFQDEKYFPRLDHPLLPRYPGPVVKPIHKVAVFFRFGDYCILPHHQQELQRYYGEAISKYEKGTEFILFSDTLEKLVPIQKELEAWGYPNQVCGSKTIESTIRMAMMCRRGFIGANSTFSWWVGWMGWNVHGCPADYKAVYPDKWLQGQSAMNLFGFPFTHSIKIDTLDPKGIRLDSFHY